RRGEGRRQGPRAVPGRPVLRSRASAAATLTVDGRPRTSRQMMRPHLWIALLVLPLAACGGGGAPARAPGAADATISQRTIEYFQKTVTNPGVTFKVTKLEDSEIPGWRKGTLNASLGAQTQDVAFYVSRDGHYMFRGDAVDLTIDPIKQVMNKIK